MKTFTSIKTQISALVILTLSTQAGFAALVDMAEYQDWSGVESSISSEDINAVQPDGMTALFWAVYYDETDTASLLLNAGANPNVENRYGMTPLIQAGMNGSNEMITLLLDAGADATATTSDGNNALLNASKTGAAQGVLALIEAGANVNSRDGYLYQTPIMWAASTNQAEVIRILVENGADMDARSAALDLRGVVQSRVQGDFPDGGLTALHHAARENSIEATEVLLTMGANPDILDPQGISPLRFALINANLDLAKVMIEAGAGINDGALVDLLDVEMNKLVFIRSAKNYDNQTTVAELVSLMFEMGVDVDAYPEKPFPFPATGFRGGEGTATQTPLYNATAAFHTEFMTMLLDHGANPNSLNKGGNYLPLSAALAVAPGVYVPGTMDEEEYIPSIDELSPAATMLFEHGADVNTATEDGTTVLHHAAAMGRDQVVEYLIAQGADLTIKDKSNRTALDVANGVAKVGKRGSGMGMAPAELPYYESTATLLYQAMSAQGVAIEDYVAPPSEEESEDA